jgi:hypothetical protein
MNIQDNDARLHLYGQTQDRFASALYDLPARCQRTTERSGHHRVAVVKRSWCVARV